MAKHGHDIEFGGHYDPESIVALREAHKYDVIVGQRFTGYDGMSAWRRARRPNNRLVYEVDDNMFDIERVNINAHNQFMTPVVQDAMKTYAQMSDLMTVTTETLAQVQRDMLGVTNIAVLPNCIPEYLLDMPMTTNRRPRIGWCGGASHGLDVAEASAQVRRFLNRNTDWDLHLGGTDYRPTFNLRNWDQMLFTGWTQINEDERKFYEMIDFEIGIAPVRDTVFGRSKSPLKCLEYNAKGIPVIASDVAPYREYVVHGENGFLVKQPHEWGKYLNLLTKNPDLLKEMSGKAKEHASKLTIEGNWQRWERAYEGLF